MKPHVLSLLPEEDVNLFLAIRKAVIGLPDIDLGVNKATGEKTILSCHILAKAVAKLFSQKCMTGYLYPSYQHSWILTKNGNIIDVYPVAILGGPLMISGIITLQQGGTTKKEQEKTSSVWVLLNSRLNNPS